MAGGVDHIGIGQSVLAEHDDAQPVAGIERIAALLEWRAGIGSENRRRNRARHRDRYRGCDGCWHRPGHHGGGGADHGRAGPEDRGRPAEQPAIGRTASVIGCGCGRWRCWGRAIDDVVDALRGGRRHGGVLDARRKCTSGRGQGHGADQQERAGDPHTHNPTPKFRNKSQNPSRVNAGYG